jgi:hypothetical protein
MWEFYLELNLLLNLEFHHPFNLRLNVEFYLELKLLLNLEFCHTFNLWLNVGFNLDTGCRKDYFFQKNLKNIVMAFSLQTTTHFPWEKSVWKHVMCLQYVFPEEK